MYSCKEPQNYVKLVLKKQWIAKKMQTNQNNVTK